MALPRKVKPGDPIRAADWNNLLDYVRSVTPLPSSGLRVTRGPGGTTFAVASNPSRAGSAPEEDFPFKVVADPDDPQWELKVGLGTLNGLVSDNAFDSLSYDSTADAQYVKLKVTTDGKSVTSFQAAVEDAPNTVTGAATAAVAPANFDVILAVVVQGSIFQLVKTNLSINPVIAFVQSRVPPSPGEEPYIRWYRWG